MAISAASTGSMRAAERADTSRPIPQDSNIIYAGSGGGAVTRLDRRSNQEQDITVWPEDGVGHGAGDLKYRLGWTQPIVISPHDPNVIYTTARARVQDHR